MRNQLNHRNIYSFESTAYHEAGHAIVTLLLGYQLKGVEVLSPSSGVSIREGGFEDYFSLVSSAFKKRRVNPKLIQYWLDSFWISDSGAIAEAEFNLVSDKELNDSSYDDRLKKIYIWFGLSEHPHVKEYFQSYVGSQRELITVMCRTFMRGHQVSWLIRTLAESLMRTPQMDGEEVIDTLLANKASRTRHFDLFWEPLDYDLWKKMPKCAKRQRNKQLSLF